MPLAEALDIVQQQCSHNRLQEVLADVQARVRAGKALSEALAGFPEVFDAFYIHLITVGEEVGSLGAVLRRIAEYLERTRALKRTVQLALVYPFIILAVAAGAIGFMLTVIVPTFAEMFEGFGAELPGATQRLIAISSFMSGNVLWLLGGGVALGLAVKWGLQTRWGRSWWDYGVLRLPFIGGDASQGPRSAVLPGAAHVASARRAAPGGAGAADRRVGQRACEGRGPADVPCGGAGPFVGRRDATGGGVSAAGAADGGYWRGDRPTQRHVSPRSHALRGRAGCADGDADVHHRASAHCGDWRGNRGHRHRALPAALRPDYGGGVAPATAE